MGHSLTVNMDVRVFDEIWKPAAASSDVATGVPESESLYRKHGLRPDPLPHQEERIRTPRELRLAGAAQIVLPVTVAAAALHLLFGVVMRGRRIRALLHQS